MLAFHRLLRIDILLFNSITKKSERLGGRGYPVEQDAFIVVAGKIRE